MEIYDWDKTIHTNYLQTCLKKNLGIAYTKVGPAPYVKI